MKGRPSLFEVMNKAPETSESAPRSRGKWWQRTERRSSDQPVQIVAEALTEEEAAEELAAQATAAAEAARAMEERDVERHARREARRAQRAELRTAAVEFVRSRLVLGDAAPIVERSGDRFVVSVNLAGSLIAAAVLCVVFVGVYLAGHRAGKSSTGGALTEVAAVTTTGEPTKAESRPLRVATPPADNGSRRAPDLSAILPTRQRAGTPEPSVRANQPLTVVPPTAEPSASPERLNYLEIQWFDTTGGRQADILSDVRAVQKFLEEQGVATVARRVSGGIRLYSRDGFLMDDESRAARQAFQQAVSEHGRTYRRQGGRYEWTDCFYVSHGRATSGEPI